ncbi:MAG: substrate-binding domain-containing protein [Spirochaetales bacterium]|nr:substrate-binding domain-containing protein [Spirochaetales bacterium]
MKDKKQLTLAFLSDVFNYGYTTTLWQGIIDTTHKMGFNCVSFSCPPQILKDQRLMYPFKLLEIINKGAADGIILSGGVLGNLLGSEGIKDVILSKITIPVINIGIELPGIPSLMADNYTGMFAVVEHLIVDHGLKNIAFIRGPADHSEETERFNAYRDCLEKHKIPFKEDYVSGHNDWGMSGRSKSAIKNFFDIKKLPIEALVTANDNLATSSMDELKSRGLKVPEDIRVTGFDNTYYTSLQCFNLTTCENPAYLMGCKSVELLDSLLKGDKLEDVYKFPATIIIRNSCGCSHFDASKISVISNSFKELKTGNTEEKIRIIARHLKKDLHISSKSYSNQEYIIEQMSSAFMKDMEFNENNLPAVIEDIISRYIKNSGEFSIIRNILSSIISIYHSLYPDVDDMLKIKEISDKATTKINEMLEMNLIDLNETLVTKSRSLDLIVYEIYSTLDLFRILDMFEHRLPSIGIQSCYFSLLDMVDSDYLRLLMAFNESETFVLPEEGEKYIATELIPDKYLNKDKPFSLLIESLIVNNEEKGFIIFDSKTIEDFTFYHVNIQISTSLQSALLIKKLRQTMGGIIYVMVQTIESRDPYTAGHQKQVADLARCIAQEMHLPAEKIEGIRIAASIHDIGKISIPAEILSKPSLLSEPEFNLIKTHAKSGFEILKNIDFLWPVAEIVYQHHEKINGSGYPRGLTGDKMLIEAKILAVADVVEAMSSHRPYRPALGVEKALNEIEKNKGILFDANVVDACVYLFREKGFQFK